ncbi:hypothetical protein OMCYN_00242 [cyanobiont of Ornithocercus magnificus]|nr:hypothetical protein OMCYN_00242 [cyanobiont of Ornithocercus magnificus]
MMPSTTPELTILYDGGCPLCLREIHFLQQRNHAGHLAFTDINEPNYDPSSSGGITYREAMTRIHAIRHDGRLLRDIAVFREAYRLVGLGWLYAPTKWPIISTIANQIYALWAGQRLRVTGRANLEELCACRQTSPNGEVYN